MRWRAHPRPASVPLRLDFTSLQPLMIGLIAGEMLAGVLFLLFGAAYYFLTGEPPIAYRVLPI